ncbi:MAG: hypothetical protein ACLQVK_01320 [Acidimicrobiales bacterium]
MPLVSALTAYPSTSLAAVLAGTGRGSAEGIDVDFGHYSSGDVDSTSSSNYQVELSFTFSVSSAGQISGGGSGSYTDAHWHLIGVNGDNGPFDCDPPITAAPFSVEVSGEADGPVAHLSLTIPSATETNADYNCGADYSGYATTSHIMSSSLSLVGGDDLTVPLTTPSSFTVQKQTHSGSGDDTENDEHIWSFSFTPPVASAGGTSAGSGTGPGTKPVTCTLALTNVSARPSPALPGQPVTIAFDVSSPAHASLLVQPGEGKGAAVAALNVPAGRDRIVWGGWSGKLPATSGHYELTVVAQGCGVTRTQAVAVRVT